jgi:hypothetical protein
MDEYMKLTKRTTFYFALPVYEFNLPAGHSCPFADECKVCVDRTTGKFINTSTSFRCYAASSERFPAVRKNRWDNFDAVKAGEMPKMPKDACRVRIHASGDFFSQDYFDRWLNVAAHNSGVLFWAFTKSIRYWLNRIKDVPINLKLQASYGGKDDHLIAENGLKYAKVFRSESDAIASGLPIDRNDFYAARSMGNFALVDNFSRPK